MSATTELTMENFGALDEMLAQHPFGNNDYITQQLHACYKRRLGKISVRLPVAGQLLEALDGAETYDQYRVIGDTVVRCAINHALKQIETDTEYGLPLDQCEQVFRTTIRLLDEGKHGPLGSGLDSCLGPDSHDAWIWSEERPDDVFAQGFRYVVNDNYGEQLCTLNTEEVAMLAKGANLLRELLPQSSRSALSHTHLIAVFPVVGSWTTRASSSEYRLSGTIFLSRKLLSNPWWVAEHLLHESLHQQLYDFRHGHSLLEEDFEREGAPTICSLWNAPDSSRGNYWDIHRALAAFHVYVHLALLATLIEKRAAEFEDAKEYGPVRMNTGSRTALVRAHYLAEQIRASLWQELGPAGKAVVDWFSSVLEVLDPSPPPQGSYIHLLLDRYWREAKEVELLLNSGKEAPDLSRQLVMLTNEEVEKARSVLAAVNGEASLVQFNANLASASEEAPGKQFARIRTLIAQTILDVSRDGYTLSESKAPDEMVRQMVERSSESLKTLAAR
jgi:hypothetical protein